MCLYLKTGLVLAASLMVCFGKPSIAQESAATKLNVKEFDSAWELSKQRFVNNPDAKFVFDRFYGFVEGRLLLQPPEWWTKQINHSKIVDQKFRVPHMNSSLEWLEVGPHSILTDGKVNASVSEGKLCLTLTGKKFKYMVPDKTIKNSYAIVAETKGDFVYLAFHTSGPASSVIVVCIRKKDNKRMWEKTVEIYSVDDGVIKMGGFPHRLQIVESSKGIFLFGTIDRFVYLVGLSKETGRENLKFSTVGSSVFTAPKLWSGW